MPSDQSNKNTGNWRTTRENVIETIGELTGGASSWTKENNEHLQKKEREAQDAKKQKESRQQLPAPLSALPSAARVLFSAFKYNLGFWPPALVAQTGNLVFYRNHESGGHFPGPDNPVALLGDLREIRSYWE
ncbi:uncharacterized protein BP01DRAFT_384960 [Aspergillus saccharolyticus JOP 1030-1]|uniref:Uncharacterized protein n=1 Tax=Aspergillus saccharolyticus JOP 1030-1 TaxID=1450539 RepID=A0A318Z9H6_9EURO|nr:hypothetical protein BP01DRAFT_384960 [Aspergillus saccharolyticus JOP 1030-1]PYH43014.1 hypothetical protein BP01DRAFT_384960 [Aspergillus saccharolyticus JOP 1030-1]